MNYPNWKLLDYVAADLLRSRGGGAKRNYYECPRCGSSAFAVEKKGEHPRFRCYANRDGCGEWGDVYDLLKLVYPNEYQSKRIARVDCYRVRYDDENRAKITLPWGPEMESAMEIGYDEVQHVLLADETSSALVVHILSTFLRVAHEEEIPLGHLEVKYIVEQAEDEERERLVAELREKELAEMERRRRIEDLRSKRNRKVRRRKSDEDT